MMTEDEALTIRRNPGLFSEADEAEAWELYYAKLREAAGVPERGNPVRPDGPVIRLVVDNEGFSPEEIERHQRAKADFDAACFWDDLGIGFPRD